MIQIYHIPSKSIVTNGTILELEDMSIKIPKLEDFIIISDHGVKVSSDFDVILREVDADNNIQTAHISNTKNNGQTFSVLFESETEQTVTIPITVHSDIPTGMDEFLKFTINQKFVDVDDRLTVLLNNYGYQMTEEWFKCFRESDINESNVDVLLVNKKSSEFLLEFFTLVGIRGSYKTLFSALSYFGFSDIVYFKEKWFKNGSENEYKESDIAPNTVSQNIFNDGYTKTGSLTLYYDIDVLDNEEPYDETGLPNYTRIELHYNDLYTKMLA